MKIGILADIHANYPALRAVLSELKKYDVEHMICAGDIIGYYPYINEVIEEIKRHDIKCILGNHDHALLNNLEIKDSYSANVTLKYARKTITQKNLKYLSSLNITETLEINGTKIILTHGGTKDPLNEYIYFQDDLNKSFKVNGIFIGGHTHIRTAFRAGQLLYLNPGSCGQPRDFDIRASCCVLDVSKNEYKFLRVMYDIDAVYKEMGKLGFDPRISWSLYTGDWIGKSTLKTINHLKIGSLIKKFFNIKVFGYCLYLERKLMPENYNCFIKDDVAYIISSPIYFKNKSETKIIVNQRIKLKNNAAVVYEQLNANFLKNMSIFNEIDKVKQTTYEKTQN